MRKKVQEVSLLKDSVCSGLTLVYSDAANFRIIRKHFAEGSVSGWASLEAIQTNHVADPEASNVLGLLCHELREVFFFRQVVLRNKFLRLSLIQSQGLCSSRIFSSFFLNLHTLLFQSAELPRKPREDYTKNGALRIVNLFNRDFYRNLGGFYSERNLNSFQYQFLVQENYL